MNEEEYNELVRTQQNINEKMKKLSPDQMSAFQSINDPTIKDMKLTVDEIKFTHLSFETMREKLRDEQHKIARLEIIYSVRKPIYLKLTNRKCDCDANSGCDKCYESD